MSIPEMHVIFGTGPAGSTLAEHLHMQGKSVRCINRSGKAALSPGIQIVSLRAICWILSKCDRTVQELQLSVAQQISLVRVC